MSYSGKDYYDLDAILAEEELIQCTTLAEFSYLAHLDPDATLSESKDHYLKEQTKLKLPIWAMESWAILGYCRCSLPRLFGNKFRERFLLSNEGSSSESLQQLPRPDYFRAGKKIANLMQLTYLKQKATANQDYLDYLQTNSQKLKRHLHNAFVGTRFAQWLDWSWTAHGQDVSQFTAKLTELERSLFTTSALAWSHHFQSSSAKGIYGRRRKKAANDKGANKRTRLQ